MQNRLFKIVYPGVLRPAGNDIFKLNQFIVAAGNEDFNPSVEQISHPAAQAEFLGASVGELAKPNSLYSS